MPYIKEELRTFYDGQLSNIIDIKTKGELEYIIFKLMKIYMGNKKYNYSNLHDVCYSAMHCADEFRRRFLDEREDSARLENGDIE